MMIFLKVVGLDGLNLLTTNNFYGALLLAQDEKIELKKKQK